MSQASQGELNPAANFESLDSYSSTRLGAKVVEEYEAPVCSFGDVAAAENYLAQQRPVFMILPAGMAPRQIPRQCPASHSPFGNLISGQPNHDGVRPFGPAV